MAIDLDFDKVLLLTSCDGLDASIDFFDRSPYERPLSPVNDAQVDTAVKKFGTGALFTSGTTGSYLQFPNASEFNFGTDDFTIEGWIYPTTGRSALFDCQKTANAFQLWLSTPVAGVLRILNADVITGIAFTQNAWQHILIQRTGVDLIVAVEGIQQGSTYNIGTTALDFSSDTGIGGSTVSNTAFAGSIDEVRITKGLARYDTLPFTPPTDVFPDEAPDGDIYWHDVQLLLHCDGTDNATAFPDASDNDIIVTAVGNAHVDTTIKKWGTGSAQFDGSGDYLTVTDTTALDPNGDAITIECNLYPTGSGAVFSGQSTADHLVLELTSSTAAKLIYNNTDIITGTTLIASTWQHVALVRASGNIYIIVDGAEQGTYNIASGTIDLSTNFTIGGDPTRSLSGYIDDFRITTEVARYSYPSNVAVPEFAYLEEPSLKIDPYFDEVKLLVHCDGVSGATVFVDDSNSAHVITPSGNIQVSTNKKFGTGAITTTAGYISIPDSPDWVLGNTYTIEMWIRTSSSYATKAAGVFGTDDVTPADGFVSYMYQQDLHWQAQRMNIAANNNNFRAWCIVMRPSGGQLYLDGVHRTNIGLQDINTSSGNPLIFGNTSPPDSQRYWQGGMDEIRITKGKARYNGNYKLFTDQFPDVGVTQEVPLQQGLSAVVGQTPGFKIGNKELSLVQGDITIVGDKIYFGPEILKSGDVVVAGQTLTINNGHIISDLNQGTVIVSAEKMGSVHVHIRQGDVTVAGNQIGFGLVTVVNPEISSRRFIMTVTGFNNGIDDAIVPFSNFTTRNRAGGTSTVDITVPNGTVYNSVLNDRKDGTIKIDNHIEYTDGSIAVVPGVEYDIGSLNSSQGGRSHSVTMRGNATIPTNTTQKVVKLTGVSLIVTQANGAIRVRCDVDLNVLTEDAVELPDGSTIQAVSITVAIGDNFMFMEITSG